MKIKVAINGFGRVGRNAFRVAYERGDIEVVAINDIGDIKTLAYLLKHDTIYGAYPHKVSYDSDNITVDDKPIRVYRQADPALLSWGDLGVEVVIEATGRFSDSGKARVHIDPAGAKRVVISSPVEDQDSTAIIFGVNEESLKTAGDVVSAASCTTNCISPVIDMLDQNFGVDRAMTTTVHSYTSSQSLLDKPAKNLRESRAAASNIVPTTTGASIAVEKVIPKLQDRYSGLSVRVPTPIVSMVDMVIMLNKSVTVEEIVDAFKKAAEEPYYQGILAVTDEELVSTDFIGNSHSAIIDLKLTNVIGGNMLKVVAWYDNEWGYCNRLVELAADTGKILHSAGAEQNNIRLEETHIS